MAIETRPTYNEDICRALGLDPDDVMAIDIKIRPSAAPEVIVTKVPDVDQLGAVVEVLARYELVDRPNLDHDKEHTS